MIKKIIYAKTWVLVGFPLMLACFFLSPVSAHSFPIPVFPGAEGFGSTTSAGRGGNIIRVTNLNDNGPGSFRSAVDAEGPRIIVYEVGGTILLKSNLKIKSPFVTIAGQTAPSPGITLKGAGIVIETHDVLIQHIRIRVGDAPDGPPPPYRDGLQILGPSTYNVVVDHVSVSWAIDENLSTWYGPHNITISNSIISEGLNKSLHQKGPHSKGVLIGDHSKRVALISNLLAHNVERNPRIKGDSSVMVINNLVYNGRGFMSIGSDAGPALVSAVGNVFIDGPDTVHKNVPIKIEKSAVPVTKVYLFDNLHAGRVFSPSNSFVVPIPPLWVSPLTLRHSSDIESYVPATAGARPADRDSIDQRIIAEVKSRSGRIIDSQDQVGGWPQYHETSRSFLIPSRPNDDDDHNGYTNIEELLHEMSTKLEGPPPAHVVDVGTHFGRNLKSAATDH